MKHRLRQASPNFCAYSTFKHKLAVACERRKQNSEDDIRSWITTVMLRLVVLERPRTGLALVAEVELFQSY